MTSTKTKTTVDLNAAGTTIITPNFISLGIAPSFRPVGNTADVVVGNLVWYSDSSINDILRLGVVQRVGAVIEVQGIATLESDSILTIPFEADPTTGVFKTEIIRRHSDKADETVKLTLYTDDIIGNYKPKQYKGGTNPSKVYVEKTYQWETPMSFELYEVDSVSGNTVNLVDHNDVTPTMGKNIRSFSKIGNERTYNDIIDRARILPKDLVDLYLAELDESEVLYNEPMTYTIDDTTAAQVNTMLRAAGVPPIADILTQLNTSNTSIKNVQQQLAEKIAKEEEMVQEIQAVKNKMAGSAFVPPTITHSTDPDKGYDDLPSGEVVWTSAVDVFKPPKKFEKLFSFDVPVWKWYKETVDELGNTVKEEVEHPLVPPASKDYIFRPESLLQLLWALITNKKAWLSGHTGTGKSTLVAEVAARLNYPVIRINFDSEITRMDLIGRETLRQEDGTTVSEFVDGILPQAMVQPCILLCDEMDFIRPDVSYVFQRALEDQGLLITEDGGRMIHPHNMFRIIATANTQGQGDEYGQYQGARTQSSAFLDRFTVWIEVEYLKMGEEKSLIKSRVPELTDDQADQVIKYVKEHRAAFTNNEITQPISPRGVIALSQGIVTFSALYPTEKEGILVALKTTVINKSNPQDQNVLMGIVDRVFA
jgi:cobaltochelatase CobS